MARYPAASSYQKMGHCGYKEMDMFSNNTQVGCNF